MGMMSFIFLVILFLIILKERAKDVVQLGEPTKAFVYAGADLSLSGYAPFCPIQ